MKGTKTDGTSTQGECCRLMDLALNRSERFGLAVEQMINFRTGVARSVLIYRMRRAKKGEPHPEFKDSTFAIVTHCPFCGKKQRKSR